jgi:DNA polymerase I-like protein with 3'-5' exonuclease and polymerase domains
LKSIKYGVLDVESTIFQRGNPFALRNKLCFIGLRVRYEDGSKEDYIWTIEYGDDPYATALDHCRSIIALCPILVGFNLKFDLNWLTRYGIVLAPSQRVYDCQLAEFILGNQNEPYPSLDGCLARHGLSPKSNVVESEYWAHGIDTPQIPFDVITEYLGTDLERTDELYQVLLPRCSQPLYHLHMQDLRVLQEMESNGLLFDWDGMAKAAQETERELEKINETIRSFVPSGAQSRFNSGSGDHLSCLLYGGRLSIDVGTEYQHTYKGGARAGQTEPRYRWSVVELDFPRLVAPPEGSNLKKEGFYSVDEATLSSLRTSKAVGVLVKALLRRAELEKLNGTYYRGIPKLCEKYDWSTYCYGTFNQCRVVTGRLSSEKPNRQNFPDVINQFIISRYESAEKTTSA